MLDNQQQTAQPFSVEASFMDNAMDVACLLAPLRSNALLRLHDEQILFL